MANLNRLKVVLAEQQKTGKMACRTDWVKSQLHCE